MMRFPALVVLRVVLSDANSATTWLNTIISEYNSNWIDQVLHTGVVSGEVLCAKTIHVWRSIQMLATDQ